MHQSGRQQNFKTVYLNRAMYGKLESLQGTIVKAFLGLSRYSHHSDGS